MKLYTVVVYNILLPKMLVPLPCEYCISLTLLFFSKFNILNYYLKLYFHAYFIVIQLI